MSVRVIAGKLKHQVLRVPPGLGTRPTGARVREALFSILGDVAGYRVLDLYAGSGALGIEALSRGAAFAVFVERERRALETIQHNVERLGIGAACTVMGVAVDRAMTRLAKQPAFDLVFCDPPWSDLPSALPALQRLPPLLTDAGRVIVEHPRRDTPEIDGLVAVDRRTWGDTGVSFFTRPEDGVRKPN